jgi:hypothetical protein
MKYSNHRQTIADFERANSEGFAVSFAGICFFVLAVSACAGILLTF